MDPEKRLGHDQESALPSAAPAALSALRKANNNGLGTFCPPPSRSWIGATASRIVLHGSSSSTPALCLRLIRYAVRDFALRRFLGSFLIPPRFDHGPRFRWIRCDQIRGCWPRSHQTGVIPARPVV